MKKLIITAALDGAVTTKAQNPALPVTPDELAEDALKCYEAGAAVVHVHARDENGKETQGKEIYQEIHDKIKDACPEIIVQISTSGRDCPDFGPRSEGLLLNPEMASLTTGSVNFASKIYENSPETIEKLCRMMLERNIKPEIEIFDTSMIVAAKELAEKGLLKKPLYFDLMMGVRGAQPADFAQLNHLLTMLPEGSEWCISGISKNQQFTTMMGIALGGHVRVGLEDNIYYRRGELATNAQLVARAVRIAREFGREIATPDEAREILGIKRI